MKVVERYIMRRAFVVFMAALVWTLAIVWTTQVLAKSTWSPTAASRR